jgi:alpha-dioxygenase
LYLELRRTLQQKYNLIAVGNAKHNELPIPGPPRSQATNGVSASNSKSGHGFFGRNMQPQPSQKTQLLDPHPSVVAAKLLSRRKLQDYGSQFNMLAASWINFMIHDWIDHQENLDKEETITAPVSVAAQCPLKSFKFYPTKEVEASKDLIGHINIRTPWWDASVIYGSTQEAQSRVRTFTDGKLKIRADGWLASDDQDLPVAGDIRNLWVGVATLQSLFIAEHNSICDTIKKAHPTFSDEEIFQKARLVNAAVLAKIHTIDWTTQLLKNNVLLAAMRVNWYGLLGEWFKKTFGTTPFSLLSGLVGMKKPVDHGVPYSLTEEFTSVYRLHPLLPEKIDIKNINAKTTDRSLHTPPTVREIELPELLGDKGNDKALELGVKTLLTSLGHQSSGALTLFNYPTWMRNVTVQNEDGTDRPEPVDMASLEIYRDRERMNARYNQFRRSLMMPTIRKWEDLTDDKETLAIIRELYGNNVERLDLLVGLLLEKKIKGFAISETAFFIFLLMASRRLEADKLFTTYFKEEFYTKEGLKWVNTTEGLKDVLRRHHPELVGNWMTASSAFSLWNTLPEKPHWWTLYLRWGTGSPAAQ